MPKQRFESLLANYCAPALKQYKYANMFHLQKTMIVFDHSLNNTINNSIQKGSSLSS